MNAKSDHVFVIKDHALDSLPLRPFRSGLFGKTLEDALQTLVEKYPQVLPGAQMDPGAEDPPRFALLRREAPVSGWSLDHLMVDQNGVLTLVEAKLTQNPESRREVIGQIMDYAANARETWANGAARVAADEFWQGRGQKLDDILRQAFGDDYDPDPFWASVEENLRQGQMRLVIVGDEIRPEVRRIIEFLNQEMTNVEVYGVELRCFGEDDGQVVLVPTLIGQTQAIVDRKTNRAPARVWQPEGLRRFYAAIPGPLGQRLTAMLDWAMDRGFFIEARSQGPQFSLRGSQGGRIISVSPNGTLFVWLDPTKYLGGTDEKNRLVVKLNEFPTFDLDATDTASGRNARGKITDLDDAPFKALLAVCEEFCKRG